jgi:2-hydroxycyclohexanecarboxyl-CoA dehydrogenase
LLTVGGLVILGRVQRVAVVTGSASGMGRAIAERLASLDHRVALFDLDDAVTRTADEIGGRTVAAQVDVRDRAAVDDAIAKVRSEFGPIEIMVTSAGFDEFTPFTDITLDAWERILAVNLTGTFNCIQSAIPDMVAARWGRIVTISSSSAQSGAANMAHYVASKGGVIGLTRALAIEYAPHGITVNTIPPGAIDTPMSRRAAERGDLPPMDAVAKHIPVRRAGTPDDVAAACAFLCSDDAGYITGQTINLNGGRYL